MNLSRFFFICRLNRQTFQILCNKLATIFPHVDAQTFYIPCRNYEIPKGKLYNAYNTFRSRLAQIGLITRRLRKDRKSNPTESKKESEPSTSNNPYLNDKNLSLPQFTTTNNETPRKGRTKAYRDAHKSDSASDYSNDFLFVPQIKMEIDDATFMSPNMSSMSNDESAGHQSTWN